MSDGITRQAGAPIVTVPQRKLFDVCLELNKFAFPASRRDDALFYIRPDMCIRQQDYAAILDESGRAWNDDRIHPARENRSLVDELIYIPTETDLFKALSGSLNQLTETITSGWLAYTGVRGEDELFIRGQGTTPWFAMADAWLLVQKWKTKGDLTAQDIPNADTR